MTGFQLTLLITNIAAVWAMLCYVDAKYQYRFIDWFGGKCANPLVKNKHTISPSNKVEKDDEIENMRKRIEVLEKIVTDNSYQLDQQIRALK